MTSFAGRWIAVTSAVLVLAAIAGVVLWRAASPAAPPNVVIITLDTTRADRLSPYGFMDVAMPALDRLAREGVVFDRATTVAPLTLPAHTSLFTGLFPPAHGVRDNASEPLDGRFTTLAEMLQRRGFHTGAFVGAMVLDARRGLARGFDRYGGADPERPAADGPRGWQRRADEVAADALAWLGEPRDAPFFLWTHFYDPHRPYAPPAPYQSTHSDPYIGEIAFADAQIARLIAAIDLSRTIVVVAGDHGESLGEHGERDHGVFVYESVLRVPLIVRAPSIDARRVPGVVRLVDVMPTVLDLLDIPAVDVDGVTLRPLLTGERIDLELEAYAESEYPQRLGWSPLRALRDGRFKLIDAPRPELYDLDRDPFEERNIHADRPSVAAAMTDRLRAIAGRSAGATSAAGPVSRDVAEGLAALGYASGRAPASPSSPAALPDPKDCIHLIRSPADHRDPSLDPVSRLQCK